jgi:hypothetical protein
MLAVALLIASCAPSNGGTDVSQPSNERETVVKVRVLETVQPPSAAWKEFRIVKCVITNSRDSGLERGTRLDFVAVKPAAAKQGMFVHRGSEHSLEKGKEYVVSLDTRLPKGWESIKDEFDEERIGIIALVAVEKDANRY